MRDVVARGGRGAVAAVDLATAGSARRLRADVERLDVPRLDIVVNNAGVGLIHSLAETTEEQFDRVLAINVKAPFFVLQELVPRISDGGRIINITSFVTRVAMPGVAAYSMTKGAISTMTLWLAKQLGPRGITVNSVSPGIRTARGRGRRRRIPRVRARTLDLRSVDRGVGRIVPRVSYQVMGSTA